MDDLKIQESIHDLHGNNRLFENWDEFPGFNCKENVKLEGFFITLMRFFLLLGADKLLMARKLPRTSAPLNGHSEVCEGSRITPEEKRKKVDFSSQENEKVSGKSNFPLIHSTSNLYDDSKDIINDEDVDVSKVVNCPSGGFNEIPLNFLTFLAILMLKSVGLQVSLLVRFFTFPIWLAYLLFMFFMFPFQTWTRFREHLIKKLFRMWGDFHLLVTSFVCDWLKAPKSVVNLAIRFGWALFWSIYVCLTLVGLLVFGFVIGGITMRHLVEEPIQTTETLNFDYTKTSPVAFVPIMSSGVGLSSGLISKDRVEAVEHAGVRVIPYNHKLHLTVSLSLPESKYNRKLGVFQVRVEFLSANGKVTASSSYPSMLRFKSQSIRFVETIFKSAPLIAGVQSETQVLNIKFSEFTEGYEPTACLKVKLEQRAEYQAGAGIPQIYAASLSLESELPQFKRIIWCWRRTIFVWISIMSFLTELVFILIFFRPLVIPRGRPKIIGANKECRLNKISWYKSF